VGTGLYAEPGVMISRSVRARLLHQHKELMHWTASLAVVLAACARFITSSFPQAMPMEKANASFQEIVIAFVRFPP